MVGILGVWIMAGTALVAADFWDEKEFTDWSDREVGEMLNDSPWSKRVRVPIGGPTGSGPFTVRPGPGLGGGGNSGAGRGGGFDAGPTRLTLTVSWRSAMPVKQAFVRTQIDQGAALRPVDEQFLEQPERDYVVSVSGLPASFAAELSQNRDAVAAAASLELDRPDPIRAQSAEVFTEGETVTVVWFFPRTVPITLDDEEVELVANLGPVEFKRSFDLEDMLFGGVLVL